MTREETLKGLKACAEFLCDECPYKIYSHVDYKFRCNYKLISDLAALDGLGTIERSESTTGSWSTYSSTMMECSNCKKHVPYHKYQYCPHCGSKNKMEVAE